MLKIIIFGFKDSKNAALFKIYYLKKHTLLQNEPTLSKLTAKWAMENGEWRDLISQGSKV